MARGFESKDVEFQQAEKERQKWDAGSAADQDGPEEIVHQAHDEKSPNKNEEAFHRGELDWEYYIRKWGRINKALKTYYTITANIEKRKLRQKGDRGL